MSRGNKLFLNNKTNKIIIIICTYFSINNVNVSSVYSWIVLSTLSLNQINFSHNKLGFAKFINFFLSRNAILKQEIVIW